MRSQRVIAVCAALGILWVILVSTASVWVNGWFYRVDNPVEVVAIKDDETVLAYRRFALYSMSGRCANELVCQQVFEFAPNECPLEPGWAEFHFALPLPEDAEGECRYVGTIEYRPVGVLGPELTYFWESESFVVP